MDCQGRLPGHAGDGLLHEADRDVEMAVNEVLRGRVPDLQLREEGQRLVDQALELRRHLLVLGEDGKGGGIGGCAVLPTGQYRPLGTFQGSEYR
jgi:hypothetical protein